MLDYASFLRAFRAIATADSPRRTLGDWGYRLNMAAESSWKQSSMKEANFRMGTGAGQYAQEVFCLMALLSDAP